MKRALLSAIFILLAAEIWLAQSPAPVKVEGGLVRGAFEDGLKVYRGIPFAAPPVGDLRWRAPQPVLKWDGIKGTVEFGPACIQGMMAGPGNRGPAPSEDCLYLNIWSPAKSPSDRLPVFVWIYGGGFAMGSTSEAMYSGEKLAKKGVMLVSSAYRVGQMGFGALAALCFSVIGDFYAPVERSKWTGLLQISAGVAAIIGPTLVGIITDNLSWRSFFRACRALMRR